MLMPDFLPSELQNYSSYETEEKLCQALLKKPHDFLSFFDYACGDPVWVGNHSRFMKCALRTVSKEFYLGNLSYHFVRQFTAIVQAHYSDLQSYLSFPASLFFTFILKLADGTIRVNALLFGVGSAFFKDLFQRSFERFVDNWDFSNISLARFKLIEDYLLKGSVEALWKHEYGEILTLMRQAKSWSIPGLEKECALLLKRYMSREKIIQTILEAHRSFLLEWKEQGYDFFNQLGYGLRFHPGQDTDLKIEILDYTQETLELFDLVASEATHLQFSGDLSVDPYYKELIAKCPRLIGLNFSGSLRYLDQFAPLPKTLTELDLASCAWLKPDHLRRASTLFPGLKQLNLASNVHLNFLIWGELNKFHALISLSLSRCHQLNDDDLKLIGKGSPHLIELNLDECRSITDNGLADYLAPGNQLIALDISHSTLLTDKSLVEIGIRCLQLSHLSLYYSKGFTDKGLLQLTRLRNNLTYLNIQGCDFSPKVIESIQNDNPLITFED